MYTIFCILWRNLILLILYLQTPGVQDGRLGAARPPPNAVLSYGRHATTTRFAVLYPPPPPNTRNPTIMLHWVIVIQYYLKLGPNPPV